MSSRPKQTAGHSGGAPVGFAINCQVHFKKGYRGRKIMKTGQSPPAPPVDVGRIPRVARLMALAIHFEGLIKRGVVRDYADIARLGLVTRARVTQIMNLLLLAPDIQEEILFLPRVERGRDPITERHLRAMTAIVGWPEQRNLWRQLKT